MSDEGGLKWLVEEREMWKRRAEWAEAELVRRDAELATLPPSSDSAVVQIPRPAIETAEASIHASQNLNAYTAAEVLRGFATQIGESVLRVNGVQGVNFGMGEIRTRVVVIKPSMGVLRPSDFGRWFQA